jgi:2-polyprenyl-3-methyl-5-hydroxy-6-metoxy-1,4-benzoquinol methylase
MKNVKKTGRNNPESNGKHHRVESEQVFLNRDEISTINEQVQHASLFMSGEVSIGYIDSTNFPDTFSEIAQLPKSFILAESENTDLIPAVYEGGLKIWECTKDLADYLTADDGVAENLEDKRVLDLGCGAGILGLVCLKQKAAHVEFQDYNKEVLEHVTITNVILNLNDDRSEIAPTTFYSGDWSSYAKLTGEADMFDIILTCETIYNVDNYEKLVDVFDKKLRDEGVVYLAAKTYYFGVGGGTRQFEEYLKSRKNYTYEVVWKNSDGVAREILKLQKKLA